MTQKSEYALPLADTIVAVVNSLWLIFMGLLLCGVILARNFFRVPRTQPIEGIDPLTVDRYGPRHSKVVVRDNA